MVSQKTKVINKEGFHMRPAHYFTVEMSAFKSSVIIVYNGRNADAKRMMPIISARIKCGSEIEIQCSGEDENAALARAVELVETGLGEKV